jgi:hypothetical protein
MQLLSFQAPLSAIILVGFVPVFDDFKAIMAYKMTFLAATVISTSAFLAFLVNISTFMIIGKMSAITYNVAGHAKLCFILAAGYLLFDNKFSWLSMIGVSIAIVGVVAYSVIKMMPPTKSVEPVSPLKQAAAEFTAIKLKAIVSENEMEDKENDNSPKRSLLIFNNEPVLNANKIAPHEHSKNVSISEEINSERVTLVK